MNREHIDMCFEDGAVVWCGGFDQSVINDKLEAITNANVYGKGTFVNKNYDSYNDQEGINMRKASSMYIEAKLIDGIQAYNNDAIDLIINNTNFICHIAGWMNKTIQFNNCKFLNGLRVSPFRNDGCLYTFEKCEFILQEYATNDSRNKTLDILDYNNQLLFRIEPVAFTRPEDQNPAILPIDVTGKSNDQVLEEFKTEYSNSSRGSYARIACIQHSQNEEQNGNDLRLEIRNSKCIIKRPSSFGVILSKHIDSTPNEGQFILIELVI